MKFPKVRLSKKRDLARKWRSFRRHTFLMMQPFAVAFLAVVVWRWMWKNGYHLAAEDSEIFYVPVMATLGLAFSINATINLSSTWEKYRRIGNCILTRNEREFLQLRDERMPIILHLFLATLSFFLIGMMMLLDYKYEMSGIVSVFIISFLVALYWIVVPQLENPAKSAWFAERIPGEWLEIDIDIYFELEERNGKNKETEE